MTLTPDSIIATATAPGRSLRALIRLSGPDTLPILNAVLDVPVPRLRQAHTRRLILAAGTLPVLITVMPGPASYTGEDTAEIQLPGNPHLVRRVQESLIDTGRGRLRRAQPGEFTARAYLNDKLTLAQAEGVAAVIAAQNAAQLTAAHAVLAGEAGRIFHAWAEELTTLLALVEAGIDFTDQEDVIAIDAPTLRTRLTRLIGELTVQLAASGPREAETSALVVALVGLPNAGKSTLFNALLGRPRAVTTPIAGTTRDVLAESLELSAAGSPGPRVTLLDLPGLEPTAPCQPPSLAQQAQHAARAALRSADVLLWCDPTGVFDRSLLELPADIHSKPTLRVRTQCDRIQLRGGTPISAPHPEPLQSLAVCALDGHGLGPLRRALADLSLGPSPAAAVSACNVVPRHRRALRAIATALTDGLGRVPASGRTLPEPELIASALREAVAQVEELTGRAISPDDVLGRIFATFCIGK